MSKFLLENKIFCVAAAVFFAIRMWLGREIGVFIIAGSRHDDLLMIQYAFLREHLPYNDALVKDMGFPIFLRLVDWSGLSYVDWLSILWLLAAVVMTWLFILVTGNKDRRIWFLVYIFVLFNPVAFETIGRRVYRQAFLSPMYFMTLGMMTALFAIFWNRLKISPAKLAILGVLLGGVFTWTFYTKEDGIWLLMCLVAALLCSLIKNFFNDGDLKIKLTHALIILLPLAIFAAGTVFYKSVNQKYFGVYLINNRTEGELGRFVKNVYRTKSDERTSTIWAPTDVIIKFFDTSETLRGNEKLRDAVMHTAWRQDDIVKNPIQGDFLTWIMMVELANSGTCHTAAEQEEFLKLVNDEIDAAFDAGILQEDDKFQLSSSMGGYSFEEIMDLRELTAHIFLAHTFPSFHYGNYFESSILGDFAEPDPEKFHAMFAYVSTILNLDLLSEVDNVALRENLTAKLFLIYTVINAVLSIAALISIFMPPISKNFLQWLICVGFLLLSAVYAFAISWFSTFLGFGGLYYSNGIIPMLAIIEIFGAYRLISLRFNGV